MKINEQKKLILNEEDVDKLLLYRLEQIQHFLEENTEMIREGKKTEHDIILPSVPIRQLMVNLIVDYLKDLIDKKKSNITLRTVYQRLRTKEVELGSAGTDSSRGGRGNAYWA